MTATDLESLVYTDNIPGFHQVPAIRGGQNGPYVELDVAGPDGSTVSRVTAMWESLDGLNLLTISIRVNVSGEAASEYARQSVLASSNPPVQMHADGQIGDRSWSWPRGPEGLRQFIIGRTLVIVSVGQKNRRIDPIRGISRISPLDAHHDEIADTLARGLEWAILHHPELLAKADRTQRRTLRAAGKPVPGAAALTFRSVTWAPLSAFEQAGAQVTWNARTNRAVVAYRGRTLELRPFHREARADGRPLPLGVTVLLGREGPVVPVRKVAEALGLKLRVAKTSLTLG